MTKKKHLSRRTLLRGAAGGLGAAIALPLLDAMTPSRAKGQAVRRFLTSFGGIAQAHRQYEPPTAIGPLGTLPLPYGALQDVAADVALVSGLSIPTANADADVGPGGRYNKNHIKQMSPMFSGVRSLNADHSVYRGRTADQIAADAIGGGALFPRGYHFLVQPDGYQYGAGGRNCLSANAPGFGIPGSTSLSTMFNDLFGVSAPTGGGTPTTPPPASGPSPDLRRRASVLDLVRGSTERLAGRLGAADRRRIDQHLTHIREVELRIDELIRRASMAPSPTPSPGTTPAATCSSPPTGSTPGTSTFTSPSGQLVGWSYETERADILAELAALAFACDLTRTATWQISWEQCGISSRHVNGSDESFHQIGHQGTLDQKVALVEWHVAQFAKLVRALRAQPEGGGTVLDNTFCALFFGESPSSHASRDMTAVVAGCGDVLRMGEHVRDQDAHPAQLLIAGMQAAGVSTNTLGEVSGALGAIQR